MERVAFAGASRGERTRRAFRANRGTRSRRCARVNRDDRSSRLLRANRGNRTRRASESEPLRMSESNRRERTVAAERVGSRCEPRMRTRRIFSANRAVRSSPSVGSEPGTTSELCVMSEPKGPSESFTLERTVCNERDPCGCANRGSGSSCADESEPIEENETAHHERTVAAERVVDVD
jgi:hypothetical protein